MGWLALIDWDETQRLGKKNIDAVSRNTCSGTIVARDPGMRVQTTQTYTK